ncbi:SDR family NAD(P)-dependent oxidoreductase (plasmid) [Rhizobium leguminosarum]
MELENKIVIVAGGASGIGAAIAQLAAAEGASVVVADRNLVEARRLASTLPNGDAFALDVVEQSSIDALVSFIETRYGAPGGFVDLGDVNNGAKRVSNLHSQRTETPKPMMPTLVPSAT